MTEPADVPVVIEPEAAARVAELGMQAQFEQMLNYTRRSVPELRRIDVEVAWPYDTGREPGVTIVATTGRPWSPEEHLRDPVAWWMITTFPPRCASTS
jgi:hypothetical protein